MVVLVLEQGDATPPPMGPRAPTTGGKAKLRTGLFDYRDF